MPLPETFDAFVPSKFAELLARANFQPTYVPLTELKELDKDVNIFKSSFELAEKLYSQPLLDHCQRCYYLALAILHSGFPSQTPFLPQISRDVLVKELYLTCLLHDVGLSTNKEVTTHPAHTMTFEFHGGIMTYEHLRAEYTRSQQLRDSQIANITQNIMLHTSLFEQGMSSAAGILIQLSALFDISGYGTFGPDSMASLVNRDTVREIEQAFPRTNMAEVDQELQALAESKPTCLLNHFPIYQDDRALGPDPASDSH